MVKYMKLDERRKQIRENYFATGGLIIITILGLIGFVFILLSGIFSVVNFDMLYQCIASNGMILIFGLFFFIISIIGWVKFISNILVEPKKEVVYLYKNGKNKYFLDSKGKKYDDDVFDVKENKFYYVYKTSDYIYEIIDESIYASNNFEPKERLSYWTNLYTPFDKIEGVLLLPILYVMFIPGLLAVVMTKGSDKILCLPFLLIPGFFIGYDFVYKIKKKKIIDKINSEHDPFEKKDKLDNINSNEELVNMEKGVSNAYEIILSAIGLILSLVFVGFTVWVFVKGANLITRLSIIPFFICAIAILISSITSLKDVIDSIKVSDKTVAKKKKTKRKKENLSKILYTIYAVGFSLFWFGVLIFFCINIVKQEGYLSILFTLPFWIAGFLVIYKVFRLYKK